MSEVVDPSVIYTIGLLEPKIGGVLLFGSSWGVWAGIACSGHDATVRYGARKSRSCHCGA